MPPPPPPKCQKPTTLCVAYVREMGISVTSRSDAKRLLRYLCSHKPQSNTNALHRVTGNLEELQLKSIKKHVKLSPKSRNPEVAEDSDELTCNQLRTIHYILTNEQNYVIRLERDSIFRNILIKFEERKSKKKNHNDFITALWNDTERRQILVKHTLKKWENSKSKSDRPKPLKCINPSSRHQTSNNINELINFSYVLKMFKRMVTSIESDEQKAADTVVPAAGQPPLTKKIKDTIVYAS